MGFVGNDLHITVDGITFLSTGMYEYGDNRQIAHGLKDGSPDAIDLAARKMARMVSKDNVLVPIPSHHGDARQTLELANAISRYSGVPVMDVLKGKERQSNYTAKHAGNPLTSKDMAMYKVGAISPWRRPLLIDNCSDSGETAKAAVSALGVGDVLVYAITDNLVKRSDRDLALVSKESYSLHR